MSTPVTMVVGITDTLNVHNSSIDLINSINNNTDTFSIIDQTGQLIATISNAVPALRPISIQANSFAGTTTFLKLTGNLTSPQPTLPTKEILTLVGNAAGIVSTLAVFAVAGGPVVAWAGAIGVAAGVGYLAAVVLENPTYTNTIANVYYEVWADAPNVDIPYVSIAPDGRLVDFQTLESEYGGQVMAITIEENGDTTYGETSYWNLGNAWTAGGICETNMDKYDPEQDNYH